MDPLSITASVASIVGFCGKFAQTAGQFVNDSRDAPQMITEFYEVILNLESALVGLGQVLKQRPVPLPFERDHYQNVCRIIRSCKAALERLDERLPSVPNAPGALDKARLHFVATLRSNSIQQTVTHISSYTQVLQLSLVSLSLGTLWGTQRSQEEIQSQIRNLTDLIRSANLVNQVPPAAADQGQVPELGDQDAEANLAFTREIQAWRLTADNVAAAVSLHDPDALSLDAKSLYRDIPSDSGIDVAFDAEEAPFDPEPDVQHCPSAEILQHQLEQNQQMVLRLVRCGVFLNASLYQRKAIRWRQQLADVHGVPFEYADEADMNEFLADILLNGETKKSQAEGRKILEDQLRAECERNKSLVDPDRKYRLYFKVGKAYMDQGNLRQAITMLSRAFEGRRRIDPMPTDLVLESAQLLAKALQVDQRFDEARGYMEWTRQTLRPETDDNQILPPPVEAADLAFQWCRERDFDVDTPGFTFDVCDSRRGTSPLHCAVQEEQTAVVREMVDQVVSFEHRNADFATPLLLAAATRNCHTTQLLLDYGAKIDVRDRSGKTPLHLCQGKKGGVKVAQLLLRRDPGMAAQLIDAADSMCRTALFMAVDNGNFKMAEFLLEEHARTDLLEGYGRTPLFRACERGDEKLVQLLLRYGADANMRGPGQCTPLMAAIGVAVPIQSKLPVVEMLLGCKADPALVDADGQDAFEAASKAGFATEVRRLLVGADPRRLSTSTTTSSSSRVSSKSWGYGRR